jgi:hypothetical protein
LLPVFLGSFHVGNLLLNYPLCFCVKWCGDRPVTRSVKSTDPIRLVPPAHRRPANRNSMKQTVDFYSRFLQFHHWSIHKTGDPRIRGSDSQHNWDLRYMKIGSILEVTIWVWLKNVALLGHWTRDIGYVLVFNHPKNW